MFTRSDHELVVNNVPVAEWMHPSDVSMAAQGGTQFEESFGRGFESGGDYESGMMGAASSGYSDGMTAMGGMADPGGTDGFDEEGMLGGGSEGQMDMGSAMSQEQRPTLEFADDTVTLKAAAGHSALMSVRALVRS
ncbi:MAG: hypothetical protein P8J37_24790 [Fuerstiella sp.]|nr:hypothetical protein [Fuerstiella sp.]